MVVAFNQEWEGLVTYCIQHFGKVNFYDCSLQGYDAMYFCLYVPYT